jgi:DNA-directed RNA polymerase subunit beta
MSTEPEIKGLLVSPEEQQKNLRAKTIEGLEGMFPIKGTHHDVEITNLRVIEKPVDYKSHKEALYKRSTLYEPIKADVIVKDKNGNIVDQKKGHTVMHLPRMSWNNAFLINGNEYSFKHQLRTMPGVYTRQRENEELEASFNLAKGNNFRVNMDPAKGLLNMEYGTTSIPMYPVLRGLGMEHTDIANYLGKELADRNASEYGSKSQTAISKLYEKLVPENKRVATSHQEKVAAIQEHFDTTILSEKTTEKTLGKPFSKVTPEAILLASKKLIGVYKGEQEPDDRDSLEFQRVLGPDDMFKERIRLKGRELAFKIKNKLDLAKDVTVSQVLPSTAITPMLKQYISTSQLSMIPSQINPVELLDSSLAVTRLGEGGIGSDRAIPGEVRQLHPTQMGIVDPFRTPESGHAGVDVRFTTSAGRDKDGYLYTKLLNTKTNKMEWVPARKIRDLNIAFPQQNITTGRVDAMAKGKVSKINPDQVDYKVANVRDMYTINTNMVPFLDGTQGNRIIMGSKMVGQAVPLVEREAPLVRPSITDSGELSMEEVLSKKVDALAIDDGEVEEVSEDYIKIKTKEGSKTVPLANHVPMASKTFYHHTPRVSVGDRVSKGQVIADSNYTKNGALALGKNLKMAYMAYHGLNSNDAVVVSEEAANKMRSVKMSKYVIETDKDTRVDHYKHAANFPKQFTKDQYAKLQDGIVRKGTILKPGDPIITVLQKKAPSIENQILGRIHKSLRSEYADKTETWSGESEAEVVDVQQQGNKITVITKSEEPLRIGDKVSNRYGGKGVISKIVPTESMVQDASGKPIDILWSSLSVVSRINPGQVVEVAMAKAAEKKGTHFTIPSFQKVNNVKMAREALKQAGVKDKEDVYDPITGKTIKGVMVGPQYTYRLFKTTDTNFSARGIDGGYDINQTPSKGGDEGAKGTGMMEINALLAHDARDILKENAVIKGTKNTEYWRAVQLGRPVPPPQSSFAFDKFKHMLAGAGLRMDKKENLMTLAPLLDEEVKKMSSGEIKNAKMVLAKNLMPERDGLFDIVTTGGLQGTRYSHIELPESVINPLFSDAARRLLNMSETNLKKEVIEKGGDSIRAKLNALDLDKELADTKANLGKLKGADKDNAYKKIKAINALKENNHKAGEAYMMKTFPVIPPQFRPIVPGQGTDLLVSDVNHMYKDLLLAKEKLQEAKDLDLPDDDIKEMRSHLQQAAGAVIGVNPPVSQKLVQSEVKGIVNTITGTKTGFFNGKVLSRRLDLTGRGTAAPDPDLGMDEVGLPEDMMWGMYSPFIMKGLVKRGYNAVSAKEMVDKRSIQAREELAIESKNRPVFINRAPTLHRFNMIAAFPKPTSGKTITVSPFMEDGMNLDYDGDALQIHLPATEEAVKDTKKMLLSNNIFGDRTREQILAYPKHEAIAGLARYSENKQESNKSFKFKTVREAKEAYRRGDVSLVDNVEIEQDE